MFVLITKIYEYLASWFPFFITLQMKYYKRLVQKELALMDLRISDRILFIGGGAAPISAALYHQHSGVEVHVIDHDPWMVVSAKRYMKKRAYDRVHVRCGALKDIDVTGYTHIVIAKQVTVDKACLTRILKDIAPATKVLVRRKNQKNLGFGLTRTTELVAG